MLLLIASVEDFRHPKNSKQKSSSPLPVCINNGKSGGVPIYPKQRLINLKHQDYQISKTMQMLHIIVTFYSIAIFFYFINDCPCTLQLQNVVMTPH